MDKNTESHVRETRFYAPEFRATEKDGVKQISGYTAVFDKFSEDLGWFREKIATGAFTNALRNSDAVALFNHNSDIVLGRESNGTLRLKEDEKGLFMEVDLPDTQAANDLYTLIERGDIKQQSFGFIVKSDEWRYSKDNSELDERTITEIKELFDVSIVTYPAYPDTTVAKRSLEKSNEIVGDIGDAIIVENEDIEAELILKRHGV